MIHVPLRRRKPKCRHVGESYAFSAGPEYGPLSLLGILAPAGFFWVSGAAKGLNRGRTYALIAAQLCGLHRPRLPSREAAGSRRK